MSMHIPHNQEFYDAFDALDSLSKEEITKWSRYVLLPEHNTPDIASRVDMVRQAFKDKLADIERKERHAVEDALISAHHADNLRVARVAKWVSIWAAFASIVAAAFAGIQAHSSVAQGELAERELQARQNAEKASSLKAKPLAPPQPQMLPASKETTPQAPTKDESDTPKKPEPELLKQK